jgi:hypothetical protein
MTRGARRRLGMAALLSVLVPIFGARPPHRWRRLTISADPSTGLADGQTVTVTVSGPPRGSRASASARPVPATSPGARAPSASTRRTVEAGGRRRWWSTTPSASSTGRRSTAGRPRPARSCSGPCGGQLRLDPAVVRPRGTAGGPADGDGDPHERGGGPGPGDLAGVGFRPGEQVFVAQCRAGARVPDGCDGNAFAGGTSDGVGPDGTFTAQFAVDASFRSYGGEVVDCRSEACILLALDQSELASGGHRLRPRRAPPAAGDDGGPRVRPRRRSGRRRRRGGPRRRRRQRGPPVRGRGHRRAPLRTPPVPRLRRRGRRRLDPGRFALDASFGAEDGTTVDCRTTSCSLVAGEIDDPAMRPSSCSPSTPTRRCVLRRSRPSTRAVTWSTARSSTWWASGFLPRVGVEDLPVPGPHRPRSPGPAADGLRWVRGGRRRTARP